jgi:hypothetical protein
MAENQNRRRFLQTSFAAGAAAALAAGHATQGEGLAGWSLGPAAANPHVRPGRVRWHGDFAAACAAARSSGKPVFHFHMLGRLDEKFC